MTWRAISARPSDRALQTAADFIQTQNSQSWMGSMLAGQAVAAKFQELQSNVEVQLKLVTAETLLDVAVRVQEAG
jgi:hypothetical protein